MLHWGYNNKELTIVNELIPYKFSGLIGAAKV